MANNGWSMPPSGGGNKPMQVPEDSWWNYRWAGSDDVAARYYGDKVSPLFYTEEEYDKILRQGIDNADREQAQSEGPRRLSDARPAEPERTAESREMTFGEQVAAILGAYGQKLGPLRALTDPKSLEGIGLTGGLTSKEADDNVFTQWLKDFGRSAATSFTQTAAQTAGALADVATGNLGENQDYTVMGNRPEDYYNYGGSAQTIGSFADDIAIALATYGLGNYLLAGSTAARGYAGLQMAAGLRAGTATVPTLFGRVVGPSATALQRTVGALAGAAPPAVSALPELVAGRTNLAEAGADVGLGALGGRYTVGSWGGSRLRNIASDAALNLATGAVQGLTPMIPGGREFNPEEYWQSLAYGAAIGAALGVAGAKPDPRVSSDVSLGRRYDPNAQPVDQGPSPTATPSMGGDIMRQAEEMAFGRSDIQPGMSAAEAVERTAQAKTIDDLQTLFRNPDGSLFSISDLTLTNSAQMRAGDIALLEQQLADPNLSEANRAWRLQAIQNPEAFFGDQGDLPGWNIWKQAGEIERQIYVDALMQTHDAPTLVKALDLEVDGPITPDILRGKIINEWVNQAANGAGISGIENRLQSLGLASPIPQSKRGTTQGQAGPTPTPASPETGFMFGEQIPAVMGERTLGQVPGYDLGLRMAAPSGVAGLPPLPEAPPVRAGDQMSFAQAITDPTLANLDQRMQMNQAARGMVTGPESRAYPTNIMPEAPLGSAGLITAGPSMQQMDMFGQLSGQIPPTAAAPEAVAGGAVETPAAVPVEAPPTVADVPVKVLADATQSTDVPVKSGMEPISRPRTRISIVEAAREVSQGAEDVAGALHKNILTIEDRRRTSVGNRNSTKIRTDRPFLEKISDLAAGKPVDLGITKAGRTQRILKVIGDAEGKMDGSDVRRQILAGRREFAKGTIKITETPDGKYIAQMTANPLEVASATLKAMPEATIKEIDARAELKIAEKRQRRNLEDAYADIEDAFKEEVSGVGKVKTPVEVEDGYTSGVGALEMGEDSGMGNKSKNPTTQDYENWKMNVAERQAEVAELALEEFDRRGLLTGAINPKHIQFWLMNRVGAPGWKEAGKLFLDRQVPEPTKEFLDTHFESVMAQTPGLRQRFDSLVRINGTAPSKQVANGVKRRAENTAKIFDNAAEVARMAGIEDPTKVIDYMRYMRIKRKMSMRDQIMTPEEAQDIAEKLARVADDPNGLALIKQLDAANEALEGKATWARILDQNFRNLGPGIRAQLRNFPIIRTALTAGLMFGMDDLVETIEDDETYFGIPGSILRKVLGDGNAGTYAVMGSMPFLRGKLKSVMKPGTRTGIREFAASVKQRMQDRAEAISESAARRSLGGLPDAELRARAEEAAAMPGGAIDSNTGRKYEPGTQEYEGWIVKFMEMQRDTHNPNFKLGDSKGTIGSGEKWFTDFNLARVKIPFIDKFIGRKLDEMQVAQRKAAAEIKSFFDDTYAPIMQKYRKANDARIPKAMAAFDYRMSDLANAKGRINDEVYYQAKKAEEDRIRDEFFTIETPEGPKLDEAAYSDYLKIQEVFNPLRSRHLYALVSFQEGIPYYETAAHRQKLIEERQSVHQMFGAAEAQQKKLEVELQKFNDEMAAARKNGAAAPELAEFEAKRRTLQQDLAEQIKLTSDIEAQITSLDASILRLTTIDDMVVRSQETGYILRHRDNNAQYVLRLSYDGDFKMPGVRREYASRNIAQLALPDQARAFASEFQAKRVIDLTNKLNDVEAKLAVDPENVKLLEQQQRYEKALAQENGEGRKSFSEMTNIEVLDYLRSQNVKADVYRRSGRTAKLNTAAYKAINDALNAADKLEGVLVGRSNEDFSRPVNYVNKENVSGNQTLVDAGADGGVVTYDIPPGSDQKSFIDSMVEAVDDLVDGTIDKEQLRDLLEQKYTYREVKTEGTGKGRRVVEQIHIDMPALRAIVSRYLEPSMPNLAKRNNVAGYYDPDGKWTAKEHWDYITGSAEVMQGQISSYTVRSASRGILSDALDMLRRYKVDNGLAEFISSYTTQDANLSDLEDLAVRRAYSARRAYSILTLATNVSNAIQNRIYGAALSAQHQGMHILTKYGVTQQKPDGSKSEVKWMDSQAEARAFIADKAEKGEVGWSEVKGATFKNVGLKDFGITAGALIAPQTTIRVLAKMDPYWKAIYEESKRLNLQEGSAIGNYALREAIDKGTPREKVVNLLTYMTRKIENANNWTSILASASTAKTRMGITSQDFATLGTGQLSSAMETVLRPSMDRMALHNKAGETLRAEIANIQQRLANPDISKGERAHLEKLVEQKQKYVADQDLTPERVFLDSVMEYIVLDRQFEQGGWTKMDQTRLERALSKNPAGVVALTFAAPMFRATSSYLAMLREAKNTHSGFTGKLVRYAPVIVGGAALTMLMGIKANTTAVGPMMFVSDMASLGEFIYDLFTTDDDNKVTKASSRGMWEDAGEYLAEKMGMDPKFGRDYVRAFFSEGLIRYVTDMAVSSESGVFDGLALPGGQGMLTTGKNMFKTIQGYYKVDDFVGAMYNTTNALPTSLKRGTQAVIQGTLGTKLDRYGNPIKEEFGGIEDIGKYKKFDIGDAIRHAVAGKRWSEIRSTLYDMDGTFDVSTPEDAVRFANYLESTSGISFGAGLKSRKPGPKESFQMAIVERDAYYIQRKLQQNHNAFYAKAAEEAKNRLNDMINSGEMIELKDRQGNTINVTMEQALTMAGTGGNKTEQDLARKGGATVSARQQMMQDIDKWMFSTNVKNTIDSMYGEGRVKNTDKLMTGRGETDPVQYAQWKFMQRLYDSFLSESERRRGRTYYEGYNTP